ncbi:MAG: A/G-specific adenine glycosylase [Methylococcales bacterium]|nr:A/G-specific adenine glycosylase [Methylococcales bacterium]
MSPELFQQKVLSWFDLNGRKDLPWQQYISPYRVWLSEVMLQQTQVTTVIPYFNQFIKKFPDVHTLANAPIDSILHLWSGLGYYARARNLHKTAIIINEKGGEFPSDLDSLILLPGIGRSTAGAISSIAFNKSQPILDGNVRRVLARFYAISGWTGSTKTSNELWEISSRYTPKLRVAEYTQAMMDLGATICVRSKPKCEECPISSTCLARLENKISGLPTPKPKKPLPVKNIIFLMLQNNQGQILLEQRPAVGIWGGLWSFPEYTSLTAIQSWALENNIPIQSINQLNKQRHTFSHYHLDYTPIIVKTEYPINILMETNQSAWYKVNQLHSLGLPSPIKKLLQNQYKEKNYGENS